MLSRSRDLLLSSQHIKHAINTLTLMPRFVELLHASVISARTRNTTCKVAVVLED